MPYQHSTGLYYCRPAWSAQLCIWPREVESREFRKASWTVYNLLQYNSTYLAAQHGGPIVWTPSRTLLCHMAVTGSCRQQTPGWCLGTAPAARLSHPRSRWWCAPRIQHADGPTSTAHAIFPSRLGMVQSCSQNPLFFRRAIEGRPTPNQPRRVQSWCSSYQLVKDSWPFPRKRSSPARGMHYLARRISYRRGRRR